MTLLCELNSPKHACTMPTLENGNRVLVFMLKSRHRVAYQEQNIVCMEQWRSTSHEDLRIVFL